MMRRSVILDSVVRLVFDVALVLSVYLLFVGHNQPGGGFIGGLVAAAGIALRYIAGGIDEVTSSLRVRPWTFPAVGLALAAGTASWSLLSGGPPLDQAAFEWHLWALGEIHLTTATVFDTGVYLIVVGLILMIFEGLGDDTDADAPTESPHPEADREDVAP